MSKRAIFSSYILPITYDEIGPNEETVTKLVKNVDINKTLGGKGTVTLDGDQWSPEAWASFQHPEAYWEDLEWTNWEDMGEAYNGALTISADTSLNVDTASASTPVVFLYVKNLGTDSGQGLKLSLDGTNYKIYIPPQGSVNIRGDGTTLQMQHVKVNKVTDDTSVEFIIAR